MRGMIVRGLIAIGIAALVFVALLFSKVVEAKDNGQFTNSPLKAWFDQLASGKGLCCSFADGVAVEDPDWEMTGNEKYPYLVNLNHAWVKVPAAAVVNEPNKAKRAYVWPYQDVNGAMQIRCFIAGAGA